MLEHRDTLPVSGHLVVWHLIGSSSLCVVNLEHKESYDRHFMKHDTQELASGKYDLSKLYQVLDAMVVEVSLLSAVDPH